MDNNVSSMGMSKVRRLLHGRVLYLAAGLVVGWAVFHGRPSPMEAGYNQFRRAHLTGGSGPLYSNIKAAGALAKLKGSELWTVLVLLDVNNADYILTTLRVTDGEAVTAEIAFRTKRQVQRSERGIIAEALKNVPEDANRAVLWAITAMLLDTGRGIGYHYMDRFGPIRFTLRSGSTYPMQEIALDTLKRCLGVDYGYDAILWREAILKKED
ncbi:MAG: hypothetical protein ACYS76_09090 [Planctomycetota bacterium]|jgi:hypothetical protein